MDNTKRTYAIINFIYTCAFSAVRCKKKKADSLTKGFEVPPRLDPLEWHRTLKNTEKIWHDEVTVYLHRLCGNAAGMWLFVLWRLAKCKLDIRGDFFSPSERVHLKNFPDQSVRSPGASSSSPLPAPTCNVISLCASVALSHWGNSVQSAAQW